MISKIDNIEKHKKYKSQYGKGELYWGFGIENETYLEYSNPITVSKDFFLKNHKSERYSVSYYKSYKKDILSSVFERYYEKEYKKDQFCTVPLLINAYSFVHTDLLCEHATLYLKNPKPNPKFSGQTIDEYCKSTIPFFKKEFDKSFTYDGDTFEFITQKFYKTTIDKSIDELIDAKENFIKNVQDIPIHKNLSIGGDDKNDKNKIRFMTKNHPFAVYTTNRQNLSMFNNGTYHFNFTLPTMLDNKGSILNQKQFIDDHRKAIRVIQLFSPILICIFGTPDPFSKLDDTFSASSQRCSISRYIGIGTYDTDKMERGKILTVPIKSLDIEKCPYWWFKRFHSCSSYHTLDEIGMDINFNKHYFHGIEIRFFEYFQEDQLKFLLTFIVHLFDIAYEKREIENYIWTEEWNYMTEKCIRYGVNAELTSSELSLFENFLGRQILSSKIANVYNEIYSLLTDKYKKGGPISRYLLGQYENDVKDVKEEVKEEMKEEMKEEAIKVKKTKKCCVII